MKTKLIIFGITGDLSSRKLLPALAKIIGTGEFEDLQIIGVSRRRMDGYSVLGDHHEQLDGTTSLFTMDLTKDTEYIRLRDALDLEEDDQALFYLSVPASSATQITDGLGKAGLNGPNTKLLLEKPFGSDTNSAKAMLGSINKYYSEDQTYRIDHYLAKEMAQNIAIFRASNAIFNTIWDNRFIESIEVIAAETLGVESRGSFYEETGALRDVLQGHLIQLLALTIMDLPEKIQWDDVPALRTKVVEQIQPADPDHAIRAQYEGYREAVGNLNSTTETFAAIELQSTDPRWKGVRIYLATGKSLDEKKTEVRVHFKKQRSTQANSLIFSIQPNEGVELEVYARKPGYDGGYEKKTMRFDYTHDAAIPDAYEQVIVDAIRSNKSLFARSDEVVRAWQIVEPVQAAWKTAGDDIEIYKKGSQITDFSSKPR